MKEVILSLEGNQVTVFGAHYEVQSVSDENSNFGKIASITVSLVSHALKIFLMRSVILLMTCFVLLYSEMFQHLEALHNSMNQYFPDYCKML
jgi:hypothetical protein